MFHFFSRFSDFKKHFLTIFIRIWAKPKHTMSSHKRWLNASTALGHKSMLSAQRWADHRCCSWTPLIIASPGQLRDRSFWCNQVINLIMPSEMGASCLHGNIRRENKTNLVVFSAIKLFLFLCFCILFGICRFYSFICSKFSKLTKLKSLIPRSSFNVITEITKSSSRQCVLDLFDLFASSLPYVWKYM